MNTNTRTISVLLTAGSLFLCALLQTRADTPALSSFSNDGGRGTTSNVTLGWDFTLSSSVLATSLGVWDNNNTSSFGVPGDGTLSDHLISIWTSTGTFITSATVSAGGGTLLNGFRYVSIAPTLLPAGNYVIGAFYAMGNQDPNAALMTTIATAAGVTFGQPHADVGSAFPAGTLSGNGAFGPNFQFVSAPTAVPEAGSTALLLAISGSLLCWNRRRAVSTQSARTISP